MTDSCFATRLSHFAELSDRERRSLARLEEHERRYERGDTIREQGERANELFIVKSGWAYSHVLIEDGRRQILRLAFPGDLLGTSSVAFGHASNGLTAVTDCVVCPFERSALRTLFEEECRLAMLLFLVSQAERVSMDDRLASLGRTPAISRVASLLLDVLIRHRMMVGDTLDIVDIPLTQEDLGDATGLTSVHVNRMLQELSRDGLIERGRGRVRILDEERLFDVSGYVNRYAAVDTSWLPPPAE